MHYFYLPLLVLCLNAIHASVYSNIKQNVLSLLYNDGLKKGDAIIPEVGSLKYFNHQKKKLDDEDKKNAQDKARVVRRVRAHEEDLKKKHKIPPFKFPKSQDKGKRDFQMDPVLNVINQDRKPRFELNARRADFSSGSDDSAETETSSSSLENFWMDDWEEHWMQKKFEALNSTIPRGDVVNMVAARPWGVACGDPNQHDMPWGSCMLAAECDGEYRIYRGDYFCGRTPYVCCALQANNYDMYQGLDVSFEASSFESSLDKSNNGKKTDTKKKRDKKKKKRKRDRERRKKNIQKSIKKIIREIKRILTKAYRNGTAQRKRKTKELKRFIEMMKKQYRKDRKNVVNVHEYELVKIDEKLQSKLNHVQGVNQAFMTNDTFTDIVVNGTVNKENLKRFLREHPELSNMFKDRRSGLNLKSEMEDQGSKSEHKRKKSKKPKRDDFDVEYGMLYY